MLIGVLGIQKQVSNQMDQGPCCSCIFPLQEIDLRKCTDGDTPLIVAAGNGHEDCVNSWIDSGADVNTANAKGETALIKASHWNKCSCIESLMTAGADVNFASKNGNTAIMIAANQGLVNCVNALIHAEADVNSADKDKTTALILAASWGYDKSVAALLQAGADVNMANRDGQTAFTTCIDQLLRWVDAEDKDEEDIAAELKSYDKCVQLLIAAGADVNAKTSLGRTPLLRALSKRHGKYVKILIEAGADVNLEDADGITPLSTAALKGQQKYMELLLTLGADVNRRNKNGSTPLMYAVCSQDNTCAKALIEARADVNKADKRGDTALSIAAATGNVKSLLMLLQSGAHINRGSVVSCPAAYRTFKTGLTPITSMLLFAAGERFNDRDLREKINTLFDLEECDLDLKHLCRERLRRHLIDLNPHAHLFNRIPHLGLPSLVNDYLLYDVSLDDWEKLKDQVAL